MTIDIDIPKYSHILTRLSMSASAQMEHSPVRLPTRYLKPRVGPGGGGYTAGCGEIACTDTRGRGF